MSTPSPSLGRDWVRIGCTVILFGAAVFICHHFASQFSPPLFREKGFIQAIPAVLAILVFALILVSRRDEEASNRKITLIAITCAAAIAAYITTFPFLTVRSPVPDSKMVYQVGFSTADWSLRPEAREYLRTAPMRRSALDIMMDGGGFRPGGPETLWEPWTIWTAGLILGGLFVYAYISISMVIGLLFHHPRFKPGWMEVVKMGSAGS